MSIGRVGPQVFAVGENGKWIVAARYPDGDKSTKEYFYLSTAEDTKFKDAHDIVRGPFTEDEFKAAQARLKLPGLKRHF